MEAHSAEGFCLFCQPMCAYWSWFITQANLLMKLSFLQATLLLLIIVRCAGQSRQGGGFEQVSLAGQVRTHSTWCHARMHIHMHKQGHLAFFAKSRSISSCMYVLIFMYTHIYTCRCSRCRHVTLQVYVCMRDTGTFHILSAGTRVTFTYYLQVHA
jgi:hypothetical protein